MNYNREIINPMETIRLDQIYVPAETIVTRVIEDDLVIVPIESDTIDFNQSIYSLTETGKEIWTRLNRNTTVEKICSDLSDKYEAHFDTILKDVLDLLEDLLAKKLVIQIKK